MPHWPGPSAGQPPCEGGLLVAHAQRPCKRLAMRSLPEGAISDPIGPASNDRVDVVFEKAVV